MVKLRQETTTYLGHTFTGKECGSTRTGHCNILGSSSVSETPPASSVQHPELAPGRSYTATPCSPPSQESSAA